MKIAVTGLFLGVILVSGCAHKKAQLTQADYSALLGPTSTPGGSGTGTQSPGTQTPITTPTSAVSGKVERVNPTARFVVLNFPVGHLPAADQRLSVYRKGLKVADIKVTDQRMNEHVVADILEGDAEEGDEVR